METAPTSCVLVTMRLLAHHPSPLPRLPVAACSCAHSTRQLSRSTLMLEPFDAPTDWFVYGHLHLILALPTLTLLSLFPPLQQAKPLQKTTSYAFIVFIVLIADRGVGQSFIRIGSITQVVYQAVTRNDDLARIYTVYLPHNNHALHINPEGSPSHESRSSTEDQRGSRRGSHRGSGRQYRSC